MLVVVYQSLLEKGSGVFKDLIVWEWFHNLGITFIHLSCLYYLLFVIILEDSSPLLQFLRLPAYFRLSLPKQSIVKDILNLATQARLELLCWLLVASLDHLILNHLLHVNHLPVKLLFTLCRVDRFRAALAIVLQELLDLGTFTRKFGHLILHLLCKLLFCQCAAMDHLNDAEYVVLEVERSFLLLNATWNMLFLLLNGYG